MPTPELPADFLRKVAIPVSGPKGKNQSLIIATISPTLTETLIKFGIDSDYRAAYWAGQVCHESDQFCTTEEYASGADYEWRRDLGNRIAGDGRRFKGRGLIQLTGRANYEKYGPMIGVDLIKDPERAGEPVNALALACLFWRDHGLSELADQEDIEAITRKINGGLNGLADRQAATDRAFAALGYKTEG